MPRKRSDRYDVTGKSVDDLISAGRNINRMKEGTIRSIVTRLSSAANKRIRRAESSGQTTPAMERAKSSGGFFSGAGKKLEELKSEFVRLKDFFKDPTSSLSGWKKVQKEATEEAQRKGIFRWGKKSQTTQKTQVPPPSPSGQAMPTPSADEWEQMREGLQSVGATTGAEESFPAPTPPGWTWNEEKRYWEHPAHGGGWLPYEGEGGGFIDPATGELVDNADRQIHDYDTTLDDRRTISPVTGKWTTESGVIWEMVDSVVRMDSRFNRTLDSGACAARMLLFNAIDDAWVKNPAMGFEQARDLVIKKLDQIYKQSAEYLTKISKVKDTSDSKEASTYFSDEDDW